jgi:DHA3 family macrolide efflux protein-like MFS transporter
VSGGFSQAHPSFLLKILLSKRRLVWYNNFTMEEKNTGDSPDPGSPNLKKNTWLRNYIPLFLGESVSLLGSIIVQFAIVWWLTVTTGDATILANGTIFIRLPGALFAPLLSSVVDRMDRRWVLAITDAIISLGTIFLVIMFWLERIQIWHIFLVFGISSIFGNLQWSAVTAVTSSIVPDDQLQRVEGMTVTVQSLFNLAGPVLGALLIETLALPVHIVLSLDVITATIAILLLLTIKVPRVIRHDENTLSLSTIWQDMSEGFGFIFANKGFLYLIIIFAFINLALNPVFTFLPLLVTDYFHMGASELGWLQAAMGAGMGLGGLVMTIWGGFQRKMNTIILGNALFAFFLGVFAVASPNMYWLAVAGMFFLSLSQPISNSPILAILQSKVPHALQGRVFTLTLSLISVVQPLILLIAGPVARVTGVHFWYWVGFAGMALTTLLFFIKPVYRIEDQEFENGNGSAVIAQPVVE